VFFKIIEGFLNQTMIRKKEGIFRFLYTTLKQIKFEDDKNTTSQTEITDETIFNNAEIEKKKNLVNDYLVKYSGYLKCLKIKVN